MHMCLLKASARALKIFGTDRSPNGSLVSTMMLPCQLTPKSCRSVGWTGTS